MDIGILNGFVPDRKSLQKVSWYRIIRCIFAGCFLDLFLPVVVPYFLDQFFWRRIHTGPPYKLQITHQACIGGNI